MRVQDIRLYSSSGGSSNNNNNNNDDPSNPLIYDMAPEAGPIYILLIDLSPIMRFGLNFNSVSYMIFFKDQDSANTSIFLVLI